MEKTQKVLKEWLEKEMELKKIIEKHIEFIDEKISEILSQYGVMDVYFEDLTEEDKKALELLEKHKEYWRKGL